MNEYQNVEVSGEVSGVEENRAQNQTDSFKKQKRNSFLYGIIAGLVIATVISGINYGISATKYKKTSKTENDREYLLDDNVINKIHVLEESIEKYYLEEVDAEEVTDSLYKGLVQGLGDKYSTYYTQKELEDVSASSQGIFYGIGASITIDPDTEYAKVARVLPDTPAEEAGLEDNDIIVYVDDMATQGKTLNDIVSAIKGEENTEVHLKVYRDGNYDYLEFDITRRAIEMETVSYVMDDENKIAAIRINEFDTVTVEQFENYLNEAKEAGMKGLIIDLRDNPGGNLSAVVEIARNILPKGLIVYTEDKYGKKEEHSCDGENELQVPLVVLVNENSASASEILAGAVKDYGKGTILGTKTYGKGIVQKIFGLTDGSAVKLTVSHYYTPNGNDIHGVGIEPDETLELDVEKYVNEDVDNQMDRAKEILTGEMK